MKSFLKWLVIAPVLILVLAFSVVNRQSVTVVFDPFGNPSSGLSLTAPLFMVFFVTAMIGAVLGGVATWIGQARIRHALRDARAEIGKLRAEKEQARPPLLPAASDRRTAA